MSNSDEETDVSLASDELHSYLSDQVPPLVVADSVSLLTKHPPELTARVIHSWVITQTQRARTIPMSDYLYHAIVKLHLLKEYNLIPADEILPFLTRLKRIILEFCPPEDREILKTNLESVEEARVATPAHIEMVFRQSPTGRHLTGTTQVSAVPETDFRVDLVLRRLERHLALAATPQAVARQDILIADGIAEAAKSANQSEELNPLLDRLKQLGIDASMDNLFRVLGRRLPGWSLPQVPEAQIPINKNLQAMQKIIMTAKSVQETGVRFRQLIFAAVERFNDGALQQAVSMIELAEKIIASNSVEAGVTEMVRGTGDHNVDQERLRKYAENQDQHPTLRKFLAFFNSLSPRGLVEALRIELKRERRKLLLVLLEVHGQTARAAALEFLEVPPNKDKSPEDGYMRRNLLYLLRRIPPAPEESAERVAQIVGAHLNLEVPHFLLKEALTYFPQIKHDSVERKLRELLDQFETMLLNPKEAAYEAKEILPLLDRLTTALCRVGTPTARKAVIDHALKKKTEFGNAMPRLGEMGKSDLFDDQQTVNRLLDAIRANLPLKMFGVVLQQRDSTVKCLIEALSGTPLDEVRVMFEQLVRQYPNREAGIAAAKALSAMGISVPKRPAQDSPSLMGDMEIFGLPALLQNLSHAGVSGTLTLKNPKDEIFAKMTLEKGMLRSCQYGRLTGDTAFFQIMEKPQPGIFQFVRSFEDMPDTEGEPREILGLLLEAMRRYDEVEDASVLIPDDAPLKVLQSQPVPLSMEKDGLFFRDLWAEVVKGATPQKCDEALSVDSYRVRRLLLHWLQSGVIEAT
jgi:Domain of unknown function (DUF4388)